MLNKHIQKLQIQINMQPDKEKNQNYKRTTPSNQYKKRRSTKLSTSTNNQEELDGD